MIEYFCSVLSDESSISSEKKLYQISYIDIYHISYSRIDSRVPERAEIAWVRVVGRGEVTFFSVRRKEDGVTDYE